MCNYNMGMHKKNVKLTFGQKAADWVAARIGSWRVILMQTAIIIVWITSNYLKWVQFDPYPFILLNLGLSLQAAYTGPMLLMSNNRQATIDRYEAQLDALANRTSLEEIKAIREDMENLNQKIKDLEHTIHHIHAILIEAQK